MRNDIRFAGISLNWTEAYAQSYAKKLKEMDYSVRVLKTGNSAILAYSYKTFSQTEGETCFETLKAEKKEDS
jgi:hypothetical protein